MKLMLGGRLLGKNQPVFIIGEAGVNHNGDINLARKLVDAAKNAGVDAVKFQTFKAEDVVTKNADMAKYQEVNLKKKESQLKMLKKLELGYEDFVELKKYCDKKKIIFLSTPHSEDAVEFLDLLVPLYKIGSPDLTNLPFLEAVAKRNKPIILSTGMSTMEEIKEAVQVIKGQGNKQIILLHCTMNYPCPLADVNLKAMQTMGKELNSLVGYSDHTSGILASLMAVGLGACVIEKHFTLDKGLPGPDHKASLEPDELKEMVKMIRDVENLLGSEIKKPTQSEEEIKRLMRKSIVSKMDLPQETIITESMLITKRPGTGINPKYLKQLVGKRVAKKIEKDEMIHWDDIEGI